MGKEKERDHLDHSDEESERMLLAWLDLLIAYDKYSNSNGPENQVLVHTQPFSQSHLLSGRAVCYPVLSRVDISPERYRRCLLVVLFNQDNSFLARGSAEMEWYQNKPDIFSLHRELTLNERMQGLDLWIYCLNRLGAVLDQPEDSYTTFLETE